jgi:cyclic beta-1,2-glucan synthetase
MWSERVRLHLLHTRREFDLLSPWLSLLNEPPALFNRADLPSDLAEAWQALLADFPVVLPLNRVAETCEAGRIRLAEIQNLLPNQAVPTDQVQEAQVWCMNLNIKLAAARRATRALLNDYESLSGRADRYVQAMDFSFLLDRQRQVFHIGYNVDVGTLDSNYYDLLASEARIASLIAIAKNDVPQSHWLHLSRPLTRVNGSQALLSWSGTMFEYLMPPLLMRSYEGTLLNQTAHAVTKQQIKYSQRQNVPWGISESGYYHFDASQNYQYQAFGVPGLGFKRGLGENLVITPYASLLALSIEPQAVLENIEQLEKAGLLGHYGFYEAIDYTRSRLPLGWQQAIVRSYMAHHQGMIMLSLANYLLDKVMVRRFHADPRIRSVDLLLQEQIPEQVPLEEPPSEDITGARPARPPVTAIPWSVPVHTPVPQVHYLSNGRFSVFITNAGSGYSRWQEADLTRWRADTTLDDWGTWVYVQDRDSQKLWSASYQPTAATPESQEVLFYPHKAEFRRRDDDISLVMEITVPPDEDLEVRQITLTNHSDDTRRLTLTSYGEVVLGSQAADTRHPAFNKLFIESEYIPEINGLLFCRRPRSAKEEPLYLIHALVAEEGKISSTYESDRDQFLGRGRTTRSPAALSNGSYGLSRTAGATLDSIMALGQEIDLAPHATIRFAYLTIAASSRQAGLALAARYQAWPTVGRALDQARAQSELELRQLNLDTPQLERIQQLLSVLLYPSPALRADPAVLTANSKASPACGLMLFPAIIPFCWSR